MGVVVEDLQVDVDAVQGIERTLQSVVARIQFGAEGDNHLHQHRFQLLDVHQLALLLGQRQLFQLAVELFVLDALVHQVCAAAGLVAGGHCAQMRDVLQAHPGHGLVAPVDAEVSHVSADCGLIEAEVFGYLCLSGHEWPDL